MINPKGIEVVKEYLRELSANGIEISKAYLYGSQIKGTATEESDIDLLLVSPAFDNDSDKFLSIIWLSKIRTENRIEPLTIGEKRFLTDDSSPIIGVVRQEGIEIAA